MCGSERRSDIQGKDFALTVPAKARLGLEWKLRMLVTISSSKSIGQETNMENMDLPRLEVVMEWAEVSTIGKEGAPR